MNAIQEKRLKAIRSRAAVRRWEYRQRHSAKGVWYRLRRLLALAEEAWVVPDEEVDGLVARGYTPEPLGAELEPPKLLFVVSRAVAAAVRANRAIPVSLGPELLAARVIMLVRYQNDRDT